MRDLEKKKAYNIRYAAEHRESLLAYYKKYNQQRYPKSEVPRQRGLVKHGESNRRNGQKATPEYCAWRSMIGRCTDSRNPGWPDYGGRGITIYPQWLKDYGAFLAYVGRKPSPAHSLDRFPNPTGNYEPGNVRWATASQQRLNQSRRYTEEAICKRGHHYLWREQNGRGCPLCRRIQSREAKRRVFGYKPRVVNITEGQRNAQALMDLDETKVEPN